MSCLGTSLPLCNFSALTMCGLGTRTLHSTYPRDGGNRHWGKHSYIYFPLTSLFIPTVLTAANTGKPRLSSKSRPSLSHLFCILPSSMLCASGVKQPARAWIRFRTLNPWLERWPYAAHCLVFLDGPRSTSRGKLQLRDQFGNYF